ncbi:DUF3619 family protein [Schlegelella sp. ID0723]|uniref:DUF3619 family protein n=1 Tax=Piscinibacter koreensis TaxID=2742824 RepID=A0A7Y6NN66_9BURK|nr:DUF3619 family protein [Schlegelella koreensis]
MTRPAVRDALELRLAKRITAHLTERSDEIDGDIAERLRFAREQALERARTARQTQEQAAGVLVGVSAAGAGIRAGGPSWWLRLASVAPLVALVGGLVLIQHGQSRAQIKVAAELDAALLGDDLPINAYRDAGFVEYLKSAPGP